MEKKIGVGIITCNRPEYLRKLLTSLYQCNYEELVIVVVDDGDEEYPYDSALGYTYIKNEVNLGVGKSKNKAMQHLLDKECDYIFIIEDDMIIKRGDVFEQYIKTSNETGILHLNYALGTPFNLKQNINFDLHNRHELNMDSKPNPKTIVEYKNNIKVELYEHICGMFSFFHKNVLNKIGLIDEQFYNAWEHVDHTYQAIKNQFHPPFWWFADIYNSYEYLEPQIDSIKNSSTSSNKAEWLDNVKVNADKYKIKNGMYPNETPKAVLAEVLNTLKIIKNKNG